MHCRAAAVGSSGTALVPVPLPFARCPARAAQSMDAVAKEESFKKGWRRRKLSDEHVVAQLLEAPFPTPRRSSCGSAADAPPVPRRVSADVWPPQRRHVPFSWESTPGVPKSTPGTIGGSKSRDVAPPKPPPGRCGADGTPRRRVYRENTTDDGSSEDDTFSDALDRISSSDRLAALSARLSSIDGAGSRRSPSFIMDRFLPAANAIATTSADKRPRRTSSPRRSGRRSTDDEKEAARPVTSAPPSALVPEQPKRQQSPPHQSNKEDAAAQAQLPPRVNKDDETSNARACGLMVFFPWRAKPVLLGFPLSSARSRTSNRRASNASVPAPSYRPRRSTTLGDVLEKERKLRDANLEKSGSGKEWSRLGRGTAALLGTSKRYCADARKALSRLTRSTTDGGGDSPRLCTERTSIKQQSASAAPCSTTLDSDMMPPLSPPSESWLSSHARRSNATSSRR